MQAWGKTETQEARERQERGKREAWERQEKVLDPLVLGLAAVLRKLLGDDLRHSDVEEHT
jgi:hypothetical protein